MTLLLYRRVNLWLQPNSNLNKLIVFQSTIWIQVNVYTKCNITMSHALYATHRFKYVTAPMFYGT